MGNGQNDQYLNTQIEDIIKDLKKDLLRLQGEFNKKDNPLHQYDNVISLTKHKYQKLAEENKILKSK